jgi:pyrroline-5-carboxylate reductase
MPVLSAALADSPTCIFPANAVAIGLFDRLGPVHGLDDEGAFDTAAVAAMYYAWVYALMGVSADWLERNGVAEPTSRTLIAQMTRAATSRCLASGRDMGSMAAEIARPGTFSAIGMDLLRERRALDAWGDACQSVLTACLERAHR